MKKIFRTAIFTASVLAVASAAQAAPIDVNLYGASAENEFWYEAAPVFLSASVADGGMECVDPATGNPTVYTARFDKKNGVSVGLNCLANNGEPVTIRYTSNKSVEGPRAVMNMDPKNNDDCATYVAGVTPDPDRKMADYVDTTGDGVPDTVSLSCHDVTLGASDVASEAFTQESHGNKNGIYDLTPFDEVLDPSTIPGVSSGLTAYRPVVVPFSFFANNVALPNLSNLTRLQAVLLFSGNVNNWSQFGPDYPNKTVVACMRHAGSGTHATLDKAVMRGGYPLATQQLDLGFPGLPVIYFHTSSSDLTQCIQDNAGKSLLDYGAVGYADTDKIVEGLDANGNEIILAKYADVKRLTYNGAGMGMSAAYYDPTTGNGIAPIKSEITHGMYSFWAEQWIYVDPAQETLETMNVVNAMMTFAGDPAYLPAKKKFYWSASQELTVTKENDSVLPHF